MSSEEKQGWLEKEAWKGKKASAMGEAACAKAREENCSESDRLGCEPGREERPHRMVSRGITGCQAMLGLPHPKQVCRERALVSF